MLEAFFRTFNIGIVTNIILILITAIFILGLIFTKKNIHHKFVNYIPNLLTSIGVFGTFLGIVLGLLNFDQNNIEASIPPLLAGLKTAFITSLAGMFSSLTYKILSTFSFLKTPEPVEIEHIVYPLDYLKVMQAQVDEIKNLRQDLINQIEPKLSEQMNSLRTDMNANSQLMVKRTDSQFVLIQQEYKNLQQTLFDISAINKAAFDELKIVIVDFNLALTEQFGDKFKFFHDGLVKSLEWQENYKTQFQQMQQLYNHGVSSLQASEASVFAISDQSKAISNVMEDLKTVIAANQDQIDELGKQLISFDEIRVKAVDALPYINNNLISITDTLAQDMTSISEKLTSHVSSSIDGLTAIFSTFKDYLHSSHDFIEQFAKETDIGITQLKETNVHLADDMERVSKSILSASELLEQRLLEVTERAAYQQIEQANRIFSAMEEQIEQQSGFTANAVKSQLVHLDQTLHREMNLVMTEMGNALSEISGQFVEDYTKLTAAMYHIVTQHKSYKQVDKQE